MVASAHFLVGEARAGWHVIERWTLLYQAATIGFNYFEFGFVRRGLAGTIVYLSGLPQLAGTVCFHLLSAAFVSAAGCRYLERVPGGRDRKLIFAFLLLSFVLFWAHDAGRTDMAVAGCLAMSAIQILDLKPLRAALWLIIGLAVHEASFIFGLPLALGLLLSDRRYAQMPPKQLGTAIALLLAVTAVYLQIDKLPHVDNATATAIIRSRLPRHEVVDWAIYFATSGFRGVRTSICQSWEVNPNYLLHGVSGLAVIAVGTFAMGGTDVRVWKRTLLISLTPFLFLYALANDMARWSTLSCFCVWLVAVCQPARETWSNERHLAVHLMAAVAFLLLTYPKSPFPVLIPIYSPSPLIEGYSIRRGGPITPSVIPALEHCDPNWREVLNFRRP